MVGTSAAKKKTSFKLLPKHLQKKEDIHSKNTIFVRGLPDTATDNDLVDFFSEVGPVRTCFIVRERAPMVPEASSSQAKDDTEDNEIRKMTVQNNLSMEKATVTVANLAASSGTATGRSKGFGFVTFALAEHAEKAIIQLKNVKMLGMRYLKLEYAMKKSLPETVKHTQLPKAKRKAISADKETNAERKSKEKIEDDLNESASTREKKGPVTQPVPNKKRRVGRENLLEKPSVVECQGESEDDGVEIIVEKTAEVKRSNRLPNASEGQTIFVRNVPLDCTEKQLSDRFSTFGKVLYCKLTRNKGTDVHRGTGFVCFNTTEACDECLNNYDQSSASLVDSLRKGDADRKSVPGNELPNRASFVSVLEPELPQSHQNESPFVVNGHLLRCSKAVSRKALQELEEEREVMHRNDKRNLYLLREGVIFPDSAAARSLSSEEVDKRMSLFRERKQLLERNPNLFVSKTRLSVRNMPLCVSEKQLRAAATRSIVNFWKQVDTGERRLLDKHLMAEKNSLLEKFKSKTEKRYADARITIKQAKVQRDDSRIDTVTNKPRSRGFGFIEFASHVDAVACLRSMNNQSDVFDDVDGMPKNFVSKKLVVEFAIENRKVLSLRSKRPAVRKDGDKPGKTV